MVGKRKEIAERGTGRGGAVPFPRPSCRACSRNSFLSVEEAVRVRPNPGPRLIADWVIGPGHASSGWMQGFEQPIAARWTKPLVPVLAG